MRNLAVNSAFASARQEQNQASRPLKPSGVPWLGDIPVGWDTLFLVQLAAQVKNRNSDLAETNLLSLSYGKIKRKDIDSPDGLLPASFDGYNIIEKGDVVLRLTDLQNDQTSLRVGRSEERGIITSAYTTVHPRNADFAPYLFYALNAFDLAKGFYGMGSGVRQGLNWSEVKRLRVPFPPLPEQRAIADFLDEKCAAIDAIVEEAKAGIEEYAKWKQSVVFQAVTKGLDPHAKMKDSGVEWIGEIPEEWKVTPLRFLTDSYKAGPFGSALITDQLQKTGTILVYTPEHIAKREAELPNNLYLPEERREEMSQFFVKAGDVVFPIVGSLGRALQVTTSMPEGIINQRLAKFRLRSDRIDANYFMWLFAKSEFFKQHIEVVCRGSIIVNLTKSIVGDMPIPLPALPEQRAIAAYLDEKCAAIDALIEEKKQLIEDLGVYKKSLIYETVTGKRRAG